MTACEPSSRPSATALFHPCDSRCSTRVTSQRSSCAHTPLDVLRDFVADGDACLLCACARADRCHRSLLAEILSDPIERIEVVHQSPGRGRR
jgi:hypothetical protein